MLPIQPARLNPVKNTPRRPAILPAYKELGLSKNRETIGIFTNLNEEFKISKAIRPLHGHFSTNAYVQPVIKEIYIARRAEPHNHLCVPTYKENAVLEVVHDRRERLPYARTRHRLGTKGKQAQRIHDACFSRSGNQGSLSEVFERSNIARESIQGALSVVSESLLSQSSGTATKSVKYERNAVNPRLYEWNFIPRCGRFRLFRISSAEQIITATSKSWREISASTPFTRRIIGEFTASKYKQCFKQKGFRRLPKAV